MSELHRIAKALQANQMGSSPSSMASSLNLQLSRSKRYFEGELTTILWKEVESVFDRAGLSLDIRSWTSWLISHKAAKVHPIRVINKDGTATGLKLMLRWDGPHSHMVGFDQVWKYDIRAMVKS